MYLAPRLVSLCVRPQGSLSRCPSLASSTARTTNSIWQLGSAGLPAGPGPSFLFLWHCSPLTPQPGPSWAAAVVYILQWDGGWGVRPCWSRQVGFDKADKGNLSPYVHASGDIQVLGVDLECDQSASGLPHVQQWSAPPPAHLFY